MTDTTPEWEKEFDERFKWAHTPEGRGYLYDTFGEKSVDEVIVKDFIRTAIQKAYEEAAKESREETINEAIKLSDKIEMEAGPTVFAEWRAFKRFRNTLRDSLK